MNIDFDARRPIGEALREHVMGFDYVSRIWICVSIHCDWTGHDLDFPDHVADVIVKGMGLQPEQRTNEMSSAGMSTDYKTGETKHWSDIRYDHRWVSGWKSSMPSGFAW